MLKKFRKSRKIEELHATKAIEVKIWVWPAQFKIFLECSQLYRKFHPEYSNKVYFYKKKACSQKENILKNIAPKMLKHIDKDKKSP